jgi:hypothetical protein
MAANEMTPYWTLETLTAGLKHLILLKFRNGTVSDLKVKLNFCKLVKHPLILNYWNRTESSLARAAHKFCFFEDSLTDVVRPIAGNLHQYRLHVILSRDGAQ